jgi:hypothetical protein
MQKIRALFTTGHLDFSRFQKKRGNVSLMFQGGSSGSLGFGQSGTVCLAVRPDFGRLLRFGDP